MPTQSEYTLHYHERQYPCCLQANRRNRSIKIKVEPYEADDGAMACDGFSGMDSIGEEQIDLFSATAQPGCQIHVSFPPRVSNKEVIQVIEQHATWIHEQVKQFSRDQKSYRGRLKNGCHLLYLGKKYTLLLWPGNYASEEVDVMGNCICCRVEDIGPDNIRKVLKSWYQQEARTMIESRVDQWADKVTRKFFRVRFGEPKTRWGSCSQNGIVRFHWKLVMAPRYVMDYVIIHELAHLERMDHSTVFWALVRTHCSRVDDARQWLKQNSHKMRL